MAKNGEKPLSRIFHRYFVDAMGAMAYGLFASLIIGTILAQNLGAALLALNKGIIAPTIGYEEPDPECALDVVPNEAREARVTAVLSNAFAFGGLNAVLALRQAR